MASKNFSRKANGNRITREFLKYRTSTLYGKQRWISFCEECMDRGYKCYLYEARRTYSKYITVVDNNRREFKVRFSNHKPILWRERNQDCDFFVGVTNFKVTTTQDALRAVDEFFNKESLE